MNFCSIIELSVQTAIPIPVFRCRPPSGACNEQPGMLAEVDMLALPRRDRDPACSGAGICVGDEGALCAEDRTSALICGAMPG